MPTIETTQAGIITDAVHSRFLFIIWNKVFLKEILEKVLLSLYAVMSSLDIFLGDTVF